MTASLRRRQPLGVVRREIDHQADHRDRLVIEPPDAEPAHLDQSRERRRRPHQQPAVTRFEVNAVVADQAGEPQQPGVRRLDQRQRKARLAGARRRRGSARRGRRPAPPRRARSEVRPPSHRRQAHDEARAEHVGGSSALGRRALAVLHPDAAAMRLDDLLGDRQTEARILPEPLVAAGRYRSARRSSPALPPARPVRRRRR